MPNNSSQTNKSLDEILAELEQRFGSDSPSSSSTSSSPAPRKKKNSMSPNTIVGALVFTLLVVGVASAMWLGSRGQDVRQQASVTYPQCGAGSSGGCNIGDDAGTTRCGTGGAGVCQNTETNAACTCDIPTVPTHTPNICNPQEDSDGGIDFCDRSGPNVANSSCTDKLVGSSCTFTSACGGGTGVCRPLLGSGGSVTAECGCFRGGGGPNPSPSVSPSLSPTPTPTPTPGGGGGGNTPTPTPVAGQCVSLTMTNLNGSTQPPRQGDSVTFTCGQVAGATRYEFRVLAPGSSTWTTLAPSSSGARVSVPFTFSQNGSFRAQCRPCTGTAASTCQAWEQ